MDYLNPFSYFRGDEVPQSFIDIFKSFKNDYLTLSREIFEHIDKKWLPEFIAKLLQDGTIEIITLTTVFAYLRDFEGYDKNNKLEDRFRNWADYITVFRFLHDKEDQLPDNTYALLSYFFLTKKMIHSKYVNTGKYNMNRYSEFSKITFQKIIDNK